MTLINNIKANLATIGTLLLITISGAFYIGKTQAAVDVEIMGAKARLSTLERKDTIATEDVQKINSVGIVSTYSLIYTMSGRFRRNTTLNLLSSFL